LTFDQFVRFAAKVQAPTHLVTDTVKETVYTFRKSWPLVQNLPLPEELADQISEHFQKIPIFNEVV
jgi:hypothetical protein